MKKSRVYALISCMFCIIAVSVFLADDFGILHSNDNSVIIRRFPRKYHVKLDVNLDKNTFVYTGNGEYRVTLLCPIPVSNQYHDVGPIKTNQGEIIKYDNADDRVLEIRGINKLPDRVTIEYDISIYRVHVDFDKITKIYDYDKTTAEYKKNSGDTDGYEINHPEILKMSEAAWTNSKNTLEYARNCYRLLQDKLKWKNTGKYGTMTEIFNNSGGDCGALSNVFITLMRTRGIPARQIAGGGINNKLEYETHAWTEFYLERYGWIPVDPSMTSSIPYFGYFSGYMLGFYRGVGFIRNIDGKPEKFFALQLPNHFASYTNGNITGTYHYNSKFTFSIVQQSEEGKIYNSQEYTEKRTNEALQYVNNLRKKKGKAPYTFSGDLSNVLREKIKQKALNNIDLDLTSEMARINYASNGFWKWYADFADADYNLDRHVFESLKNEESLYNDNFSEISIGYYYNSIDGGHTYSIARSNPVEKCRVTVKNLELPVGAEFMMKCPASGCSDKIWGTDIYTYDSPICSAAVHSGLIGKGGGSVKVKVIPGQKKYTGIERNGIKSIEWGEYERSYSLSKE